MPDGTSGMWKSSRRQLGRPRGLKGTGRRLNVDEKLVCNPKFALLKLQTCGKAMAKSDDSSSRISW